jgi:hypothetical protein
MLTRAFALVIVLCFPLTVFVQVDADTTFFVCNLSQAQACFPSQLTRPPSGYVRKI